MKTLLLITTLLLCNLANSQTLRLDSIAVDGRTIEKVKIEKVSEFEVRITSADGIKRIPFDKLPVDIQNKLGVDKSKQQELINKAKAESERKKIEASAVTLYVKIIQITNDGMLCELYPMNKVINMPLTDRTPTTIFIRGHVKAVDNDWIEISATPETEPYIFKTVMGSKSTVNSYKFLKDLRYLWK